MLRPTPGDPWGVEQHHWNTGAKENQQLNPGGPSNKVYDHGLPPLPMQNLYSIMFFGIFYFICYPIFLIFAAHFMKN